MGGFRAQVGLMALPTFHVMVSTEHFQNEPILTLGQGFVSQCFYPQFAGFTSVLFAPRPTPVVPSPDATLRVMARSQCSFLLSVPAFLEVLTILLHFSSCI
jgi:hypothetical protein